MAVARVAIGTTARATTATVAVPYPASLAAGQVALLFTESGNGADPAAPTGFTHAGSIGVGSSGTDVGATKFSVFYRVLDGSESGSVTANSINGHINAKMVTYSGADATTPITLSAGTTQTPANTTQSTGPIASKTGDGNDVFISVAGHDRNSATQSAYGSPVWNNIAGTNFSLIQTSYNGGGGGGIVAQELSPSGDSTGAVSGSGTITSSIWAGFMVRVNASGSMGGGAVNTNMTADVGTFSYTGQAANLLAGTVMTAASGTFSYTGQAGNMLRGYSMPAAVGTFTYSGQAANLKAAYILSAAAGVFSYNGQAAAMLLNRVMPAATGTFTYNGQPANFLIATNITMAAATGTFSYTGQAANLRAGVGLIATAGVFSYTGYAAGAILSLGSFPSGGGGAARPTVVAAFIRR